MKNLNKVIALTLTAAVFCTNVNAQASFSATASATATVITPLGITNVLDMSFGNLSVNAAGTVILTPAATRTATGGVTLPVSTPGTVTAATFDVTGTGTYTYAITLPSTPVTLTHSGGAGTGVMTATAFSSTPSGTGTLASGAQTIAVGATLNVAAAQPAGVYTTLTEFTVTVNYN